MDGVREVIGLHKKRDVKIITSVLTRVEVLQSKLPAGLESLFSGLLRRVTPISMETKIAQLAHDIRDYYAVRSKEFGGKILSTPDAIHLATAILYRASEFHTFDNDGDARHLGLLPLSGNVAGHKLTICKPKAKNPGLDLRNPNPTTPRNRKDS
jgi:predicted nucleic acid-binding protein